MRIDKYLWAMRVFKTRSQASKACNDGQVKIDDTQVKPSRVVRVGEVINVRKLPIWRSYKVLGFPKSRVGAKLVEDYTKEVTDAEELEKFETWKLARKMDRPKGEGRPTKRDRRDLDELLNW